jgi:hypothetical protein
MNNGLVFLMIVALFQQCNFLPHEASKRAKTEVCNALGNLDVANYTWQKVPQMAEQSAIAFPVKNPKEELELLRYLQISDREADEFSILIEAGDLGSKSGKWFRKKNEDGLQWLTAQWDPAGNCRKLSARVDEKNSLFERHLNLDLRFLSGDTVALLQISGFQKIIFTDPIHYHVEYIATKP